MLPYLAERRRSAPAILLGCSWPISSARSSWSSVQILCRRKLAEWEKQVADLAQEICSAVATARNPESPPLAVARAALKLKQIRHDTTHVDLLVQALFRLVGNADETRRVGLKMLRDLVRDRWEELGTVTKNVFLANVHQLVEMSCSQWDTKSETAEFIAEMARKCICAPGFDHLADFEKMAQDEVLGMILKYLQDDITIDTHYLKGDSRASLFRHLTELAPRIIKLLISLFMKHAAAAYDMNAPELVQQANAAIVSILSALSGYVAWAPIKDVSWSPVIDRCVIWLSAYKSIPACNFLKVICQREPTDGTHEILSKFLAELLNISQGFTSGSQFQHNSDCEFTECICDTMVDLGCSSVHSVLANEDWILKYLQEMLHYYQHQRIELQYKSLSFWLVALKESPETEKENKMMIASYIPEHMYPQLLDISVKNMLKKGAVPSLGPSGPSNKGFQRESDFSDHRTKLLDLMRIIASERPVIAAEFVTQRFNDMLPYVKQGQISSENLQTIGNTLVCLDHIVNGIFGDACYWNNQNQSSKEQIHNRFEGLLVAIVDLDLSETWAIELHGRFLSLFGLYCKNYPNEIGSVVDKFLSLLVSLPAENNLPSDSNEARFTICALLIDVSEVACDAFAPEKGRVLDILDKFQNESKLLDGEYEDLRRQLVLDEMNVN